MTEFLTFDFNNHAVRILELDGAPWWVATDIASILGYSEAKDMVRNLDDDEADRQIVPTSSQRREMTIISESGLYHAIFASRRPQAQHFRRWVTGTVLPALRRNGHYSVSDPAPDRSPAFLAAAVATVREARRLFGHGIARGIWENIGLPLPQMAMPDLSDGLERAILAWLPGNSHFTNAELAHGIGLGECNNALALRFGEILRRHGWQLRKARRGRKTANLWMAGE